MSENVSREVRAQNRPIYSLVAAIILVALVIVALIVVPHERNDQLLIVVGLIVSTVPSLLAAGFAERTARDVRNGVVQQKAREGAQQALDDSGVTDVVNATQRGASTVAAIAALSQLTESDPMKRDALALLLHKNDLPTKASPAGEGPSSSTMPPGFLGQGDETPPPS